MGIKHIEWRTHMEGQTGRGRGFSGRVLSKFPGRGFENVIETIGYMAYLCNPFVDILRFCPTIITKRP